MSILRHRRDQREETESQTQRLEAFSDGVFAIAITLLILEIHTPNVPRVETVGHLGRDLIALWPKFAIYFLSFTNVGSYWANHHYLFKFFKRTNHIFNLLNVLFLMCISFVPLPTAVLGEYVTNPLERQAAVIFYSIGMFLPALTWSLIWFYGSFNNRLIDEKLASKFVRKLSWQYGLSNFTYVIAIVCALWRPAVALAIAVGFTFLYLLPPMRPVYKRGMTPISAQDEQL